jgi:RsiW-degrading membrane proteinase PrsW (M82 family)
VSAAGPDLSEWLTDAWRAWAARHPVLVRRGRRLWIAWTWVSVAAVVLMLLLVPSTRRGFVVVLWMYYVLVQFWLLCRSRTLTWRAYSLAFVAGLVLAPLIGLLENVVAAALGWPMPDPRATVWVSGPVEETLKLLPLGAVLALARRRAARLAVVDHILLAAAGGVAFQYVEDVIRRLVYRPSLLTILLGGDNTQTRYGLLSLFPGWFETATTPTARFAGHAVTSALIGAGIGLAVHLRPRLGPRVYALPVGLWVAQSLAHTLYNAAAVGQEGIVPGWLLALYRVWGSGHLERPLLVVLLLAALAVDYRGLRAVTDRLPALPGDDLGQPAVERAARLGQRLAGAPPADAAPVFRRLAGAAGATWAALGVAAGEAWRELVVTLAGAARGPATWSAGWTVLRQRRELGVALARSAPLPRPPADPAGTARRAAQLAAALAVLAILAVAVAPSAPGYPVFLAGLFERLGEWWNGLPLWAQLLIPFGVAALLTFAGMGFWPALGLVSTLSEFAAYGEGIGTFLRNPGQATRDFVRNLTPGQAIGLLAGLVLERILPGALGGLLGRAGRGTIRRTADDVVDTADDSLPRRADDLPEHNPVEPGALGPRFHPGVHDPDQLLMPDERATADFLAEQGYDVRPLPADHTVVNKKNPDTIVRRSPEDPGVITEFKKLDSASSTAVKRNIRDAGRQLKTVEGQAVIDGRSVGLSRQAALEGLNRALGEARQHGSSLPSRIHIILGDGTSIFYP